MDRSRIRRLFSVCDVNKSGRIEFEDFTAVCQEHNVPESEIRALFDRLDADNDGHIDYCEFSSMFQEFSAAFDLFAEAGSSTILGGAWEEFVDKSNVVSVFSESLREQLADLYQAIHSSANTALLLQYEEVVHSLAGQSLDTRLEFEQLGTSLKRAEEMNSNRLAEVEEDTQLQLAKAEERVRDEERRKMEAIVSELKRKHMSEMAELHDTVDGLLKRDESEDDPSREEVNQLMAEIQTLTLENQRLQASLLQAQTNISALQTELDKIKNSYLDQKTHHERVTEDLKKMVSEYQSYSGQIRLLQEMNKQLCDSNDGLRSALESEAVATKRRMSPQNDIPARRMKPLRQSTFNNGTSAGYSHVASWADKYLDSGVSLQTDMAESSDYDSDDGRNSLETVFQSYVQSDIEISEVASEAAVSLAPSVTSSFSASLRRRLSAFSVKPSVSDLTPPEEPAPMFRLVLAGDAGSGKSSFLLRLMLNEFRGDIQSTLGVDFQIKRLLVDGERTSLQIWDTAGQERFRSIARSYFRKAHGVLLLYDVTSESSFLNVRAWVDEIQDCTQDEISMCVIGNKMDLKESSPDGSCVSSLLGEKLAKEYGALFCETSAKEGTNVVEAVLHLARAVKRSVKLRQRSDSQVQLGLSPKKSSCCQL
ncbi:ras and EF-hand domain-containing protein [Synchiropus splendidus]|uniref:ras and EF-hand domain-containing protein n=1 Tax=Synchiropus splendidus TaxID=270530 RepID=UPI00237D9335|nr:ras and EF-hand domain-containing protein [Synchiropus splendidus]